MKKITKSSNYFTYTRDFDKNKIERDNIPREFTTKYLLESAWTHYRAAKILSQDAFSLFSMGSLLHLSLELILKAYELFLNEKKSSKKGISKTHNLEDLLNIVCLSLDQEVMSIIKIFSTLYESRYDLVEVSTCDLNNFNYVVGKLAFEIKKEHPGFSQNLIDWFK